MRKVLIVTFLIFLNALILLAPKAKSETLGNKLKVSPFECHGRSLFDQVSSYFIRSNDYLIVLATTQSYRDALHQKEMIQKKINSVSILDDFDFTLQIAKQGREFLVVERGCYSRKEAHANARTLKFFFSMTASYLCTNCPVKRDLKSRAPASTIDPAPIYLIKDYHE